VLTNKNNHGQWPKVVSDDVLQHVYLLKNQVHVVAGQVKGKTLLPLPASREFNSSLAAGDTYASLRLSISSFAVEMSFPILTVKYN